MDVGQLQVRRVAGKPFVPVNYHQLYFAWAALAALLCWWPYPKWCSSSCEAWTVLVVVIQDSENCYARGLQVVAVLWLAYLSLGVCSSTLVVFVFEV